MDKIIAYLKAHPNTLRSLVVALVLLLLLLNFGLWKTIIIGIVLVIAFLVGSYLDGNTNIFDRIVGVFRNKTR